MAKPLKKGETIGVRLPLRYDGELRERASFAGVSPTAYAESLLVTALDDAPRRTEAGGSVPFTQCSHSRRSVTPTGIGRCPDCGGIRNPVGVWRPA